MSELSATLERFRIDADPASVFECLPRMGKVMITASAGGATHECIGDVGSVVRDGDWLEARAETRISRIDATAVAAAIVDRTGRMGEKVFPRVDLKSADGTTIASVVGFEGLEPFDAGIAHLTGTPVGPDPEVERPERTEAAADDPGAIPFVDAAQAGSGIAILFRGRGFEQRWQGDVETVKPAMGFINVMRPDFHLHLRAGAVAGWASSGGELVAEAPDGARTGLSVIRL